MSYILEALKRAEAQRQQTQLPHVHVAVDPAGWPVRGAHRPWPWWLGGAVVVSGLALAAGMWWARPSASLPVVGSGAMPATVPEPLPGGVPPTVLPAKAENAPSVGSVAASATRSSQRPPVAPRAPSKTAGPLVPRLADLPQAQREAFGSLKIGGAMYSDEPSARMLVVNDQLVREGAALGGEVVLERIGAHEAIVKRGDLRARLPY